MARDRSRHTRHHRSRIRLRVAVVAFVAAISRSTTRFADVYRQFRPCAAFHVSSLNDLPFCELTLIAALVGFDGVLTRYQPVSPGIECLGKQ